MAGNDYRVHFLRQDTEYLCGSKQYQVARASNDNGLILRRVDVRHYDKPLRCYLKEGCLYVTEDGNIYAVSGEDVCYMGNRILEDALRFMFQRQTVDEASQGSSPIAAMQKDQIKKARENVNRMKVIPERVYCSSPVTVAIWADGTKTMARVTEGTVYDPFVGVAVCVLKKVFGYVLPEGRSANGEVGRLLKADHERRARKYAKSYRRLFKGNPTCDPEIVGDFTAESEEEMWEAPYKADAEPEPSDG